MDTLRNTLVMALVCGLLSACGGGDDEAQAGKTIETPECSASQPACT